MDKLKLNKYNYGRDNDGNLVLVEGVEVSMAKGWNPGLSKEERSMVHAHNYKVQRIKVEKAKDIVQHRPFSQNKDGGLISRFQDLEEEFYHTILDEIEGSELVPIDHGSENSIKRRRGQLGSWRDLFSIAKELRDMKVMLVHEHSGLDTPEDEQKMVDLAELRKDLQKRVVNIHSNGNSGK